MDTMVKIPFERYDKYLWRILTDEERAELLSSRAACSEKVRQSVMYGYDAVAQAYLQEIDYIDQILNQNND